MNNQTKSGCKQKNLQMQDFSSIIWEFNGVLNPRRGYKPLTRLAGERLLAFCRGKIENSKDGGSVLVAKYEHVWDTMYR